MIGPMNAEFLLIIAIGIVGFIVQAKLQSVFKKYSKVMFPGGLTGRDILLLWQPSVWRHMSAGMRYSTPRNTPH